MPSRAGRRKRRADRTGQPLDDRIDLLRGADERRRDQDVIAVDAVDRPAHRIHHQPALHRFALDRRMQLQRGIERRLAAAIAHGGLQQFTDTSTQALLPKLATQSYTQRGFADFHGHTMVLDGRCDAMVDPGVKPWDLCALAPIVTEAGGTFTDMTGKPTIYGGSALASNGRIHAELLAMIAASS